MTTIDVLIQAIHDPQILLTVPITDWNLLLRLARQQRLLGRIAIAAVQHDLIQRLPSRAARHLQAANQLARHRQTVLTWELDRVCWALADLKCPVVALKGVAYAITQLPPAQGRFYADLDLLVAPHHLEQVEQRLLARGWIRSEISRYDEQYYRLWMHELPPLRHAERANEVDLHHALLPRTHRLQIDSYQLLAAACDVPNYPGVKVLAPEDMVLHALVHLFFDGDPYEGLRLRDLVDIADLITYFDQHRSQFSDQLVQRAHILGLSRPLYYGIKQIQCVLKQPVPQMLAQWQPHSSVQPWIPVRWLMDHCLRLALRPDHPDHPGRWAAIARWLLYIRAHWLRMPPLLLIRHLSYKMWIRWRHRRDLSRSRPLLPRDVQRF
jgi:hypothetical protein